MEAAQYYLRVMSSKSDSLKQFWQGLARGRDLLKRGVPVAVPSETVYGLAARIDMPEAIAQIFRVKSRPSFDPLIVHVADERQVDLLATQFSSTAQTLARTFWPGPLTLVLPRKKTLNPMISAGLDTVGVRCPAHPVFRRLIREVGVPLAAPSANKFGKTSPTTAAHVGLSWSQEEVFVVDGGAAEIGIESTVVQLVERGGKEVLLILRPGMIGAEDLRRALPSIEICTETSNASPGHLSKHYQPATPLVLISEEVWSKVQDIGSLVAQRLAVPNRDFRRIELPREAPLAARELYSALLEASAENRSFLLFVETAAMRADEGWTAILDRLRRASSLRLDSINLAS